MDWMIYGANGYTGRLIAAEALRQGLQPVLAGRDGDSVSRMAAELGTSSVAFALEDATELRAAIRGKRVLLHCAGPFRFTAMPMVSACIAESVHYVDITGEIEVFRRVHEQDAAARRADVALVPGAGFDVVPTDCLAASLVAALPAATQLQLAFDPGGGLSPGTARTSVERLGEGGCIRRDGQLTQVPLAWKSARIPFPKGERSAVTIPWGDVYTAYVSTGVPDISVYMAMPPRLIRALRMLRWLQPMLRSEYVKGLLKRRIERTVPGPSEEVRARSGSDLWGQVRSADGRSVSATMKTPNGYDLTATAALGIVRHLLGGDVEGGFYTPSLLMGADYAASLPGVWFSGVA